MSDPQKYRTKEEVAEYQEQDPLEYVARVILENKWMTQEDLDKVEEEIKAVVEESVKFAEESAMPEAHEIYEDVYSDPYPYVKD
jgi:pyruvate dehydrogenase E1 component alpha subunit